ncbi:GFA family protein [Streptococcus oricebi]|uniref:CENP-V/GFA domain-containing protein n=1 Tax=Streptococcus oricebi TaxID=1547447 RepID=A0ABS5B0U5_9STRE|nr:hypothetical protein [Streptococcus oricebi]
MLAAYIDGTCLCSQVKIRLRTEKLLLESGQIEVKLCHCDVCRKINAGPSFYITEIADSQFTMTNSELVHYFKTSENGQRGFCSHCGTYLFFRDLSTRVYEFNPELFQREYFKFTEEIWCLSKPDYYNFADETLKTDYE